MQLLAIRILIASSALSTALSAALFYYIQLLATAQRTHLESDANGAIKFLNTDFVFFYVAKGAMMFTPLVSARLCLYVDQEMARNL